MFIFFILLCQFLKWTSHFYLKKTSNFINFKTDFINFKKELNYFDNYAQNYN